MVRLPIPASTRFLATSFASALAVIKRIRADRSLESPVSHFLSPDPTGEARLTFPGPSCPKDGFDGRTRRSHLLGVLVRWRLRRDYGPFGTGRLPALIDSAVFSCDAMLDC